MVEDNKNISSKTVLWLLREIESWKQEQVISTEQADLLSTRYKGQYESLQSGRPDYMIIVISIIGALLAGMGVILFFAYNWDKIPRTVRVGTLLSTMTLFYGVGYYVKEKYQVYKTLGESFIFLGAILFGSAIWLIAQMYNINAHYPNGWLFWAIGAIAIAYSTESIAVNMLAAVLLATWANTESFGFDHSNLWYFPVVAIGIFPFIYWKKSKHALAVALLSFIIGFFGSICGAANYLLIYHYIALGTILFLAGMYHYSKDTDHSFVPIYVGMSLRILVVVLFMATFYDLHHSWIFYTREINPSAYWVLGGEFVLGLFLVYLNWKSIFNTQLLKDAWVYKICLVFPIIILGLTILSPFLVQTNSKETYVLLISIAWNLVYITFAIGLLYCGEKFNRMSFMYTGTLVLLLMAIGRYFDLFDNMLHRSAYFLIAGGLFIYYGFWLSKKKKAIQERKREVRQ